MFSKVISLVGENNYQKIKNTHILLVGLGGVGGYALESLVRSGVTNIIIIDYDVIDISNLNRQIIAKKTNIGNLKTTEYQKRYKKINEECNITSLNIFLDKDKINLLDNYQIDYIIDACDTLKTKELLIEYANKNNIKLISSMGTANKIDPTKLEIIDIRKTSYDPLAKRLRKYVNEKNYKNKIMVVSSTEKVIKKENLPSLIFVPATAGILCANYVIRDIISSN